MKAKAFFKKWGVSLLGTVLVASFPVTFLYFNNAGEAEPSDAAAPLLLFCAIGLGVLFLFGLITRSAGRSALAAVLFMLAFSNFSLLEGGIEAIFPNLHYWHTLPIVFVVWLELAILLNTFLSEENARMLVGVVCLTFGGLTLVNAAMGAPKLAGKFQAERQLAAARQERAVQTATNGEQPNVYLLIFDEYANFPQMEEYYDYDNAFLKDFLTENHFTISYDSHNESIVTSTVLTNLMNLDYLVDDNTASSEKELIRKQGKLFALMREHGYDVQIIDADNFLCDDSPVSDGESGGGTTVSGESMAYLIYRKTPLYPCLALNSPVFERVMSVAQYLTSNSIFQDNPTFTVAYFCFPHTPFCVDENGNPIPFGQFENWADTRYYLGQYKYATKLMIDILTNILRQDKDSIIVLQSDHGARGRVTSEEIKKFSMEAKNNPLNCVYYQEKSIDEICGLSSVNTLRAILSRLWDEEYELLEVPES